MHPTEIIAYVQRRGYKLFYTDDDKFIIRPNNLPADVKKLLTDNREDILSFFQSVPLSQAQIRHVYNWLISFDMQSRRTERIQLPDGEFSYRQGRRIIRAKFDFLLGQLYGEQRKEYHQHGGLYWRDWNDLFGTLVRRKAELDSR